MARRGAVVIGASAGVGRALCEVLAREDYDLVIASRDQRDLDAMAADLHLRYGVDVTAIEVDLRGPDTALRNALEASKSALDEISVVLVPAGVVDDADDGLEKFDTTESIVTTNFSSVVKLLSGFLVVFERTGRGNVVLFSSIAASAPRRRNVVYSAAKNALESYAKSMQHRFADSDVHIQLWALGYVDTSMTTGQRLLLPKVSASRVAEAVVRGLADKRRFRYYPAYWSVVVRVLSLLPWPAYRRLQF
jgi:short-subunit dehydrogenase